MSIYAEYLFLENLIIGYMLLYLTAALCGESIKRPRLWAGGALCGLYAFTILIPGISPILLLLSKFMAALIIIVAAFGKMGLIQLVKRVLVFFGVTVLMGGLCFAIIYSGAASGVVAGGGFYIATGSYGTVIIGVFLGFALLRWIWNHIRKQASTNDIKAFITIYVKHNSYEMQGIVDTGHFLADPISGKPVIIIRRPDMDHSITEELDSRRRVIPYKSLGNEAGILEGIRADRVSITYKNSVVHEENPIIAFYDGKLFDGKEYEAILHPSMLIKI